MSGLEIAGVVLGAFPLVISAMEHFEDCRKVAGTFYKIRRAHRKDLGKVKDCQLKFRLNLKELVLPLLSEDIVTGLEYEQLLASPGGPGWQEQHVEKALAERLGNCHERYLELLEEMQEMMAALCRVTKVDDAQFQELLKSRNVTSGSPTQQAKSKLMLRAHTVLQAKKVAYAFTIPQRNALLKDIEGLNAKLESVLVANDRISGLTRYTRSRPSRPRIPKPLLHFWRHADSMFKLLSRAWTCQCRSLHCARLRLRQSVATTADLIVMLQFCHGAHRCMHIQAADGSTLTKAGPELQAPIRLPLRPKMNQQSGTSSANIKHASVSSEKANYLQNAATTSVTSTVSLIPGTQFQHHMPPQASSLCISDLCETMRKGACQGDHYGILTDQANDQVYTVAAVESPASSTTLGTASLLEILQRKSPSTITRVQRYSIAATLASSLLQLETTPWAQDWSTSNVHFAEDQAFGQVKTIEHDAPFLLTNFSPVPHGGQGSFKALATSLLELCFGTTMDDHPLWQQPAFAASKTNPMVRQFVASQWLQDVEGEAGEQYASAVKFCLEQAPTVLKDEKWRLEFAQSVAWPLRQCHESMHPSTSTV